MIRRDASGVTHIVGVSGGKDSVCLALTFRKLPDVGDRLFWKY